MAMASEDWSFTPFWGSMEIGQGYTKWHHNPNLKMTRDEQLEWNTKHFKEFQEFKTFTRTFNIIRS